MSSDDLSATYDCSYQDPGHLGMSTIADLSYTPSTEERYRDAAQVATTGRTNWKTLRGRGEAVWPPHLEAALIEALDKYRPNRLRSTKLARFPLRNKFISDYIYQVTGKRRTAKQVGSRLQQLRDTCKGERIQYLLSRRSLIDWDASDTRRRKMAKEQTSRGTLTGPAYSQPANYNIFVALFLVENNGAGFPPVIQLPPDSRQTRLTVPLPWPGLHSGDYNFSSGSSGARGVPLCIRFASTIPLYPESDLYVYQKDSENAIHTEGCTLESLPSPSQEARWMYSSNLVPGFSRYLSGAEEQFIIVQHLRFRDASTKATITYSLEFDPSRFATANVGQAQQSSSNLVRPHAHGSSPSFHNGSWASPETSLPAWQRYRGFSKMPPHDDHYFPQTYVASNFHGVDMSSRASQDQSHSDPHNGLSPWSPFSDTTSQSSY